MLPNLKKQIYSNAKAEAIVLSQLYFKLSPLRTRSLLRLVYPNNVVNDTSVGRSCNIQVNL